MGRPPYLEFRHRVVRVWEQSVEAILAGGLGTLPLAPLTDEARKQLPAVIRRIDERLRWEAAPDEAATLWEATFWLLGLRYPSDVAQQLLQGVRAIKESSTYQAVLAEGEARRQAAGARRIGLRQGSRRFGPPDQAARVALETITDLDRLERLSD